MNRTQTVAIIPAAGKGQRMKAGRNKIWLSLAGRSILEYILDIFQTAEGIDHVVIAVNSAEVPEIAGFIQQCKDIDPCKFSIVPGGNERQDSVLNGLSFFKDWSGWSAERRMVMIHDAARVLVTQEILQNAIEACLAYKAVGIAVPVKDTVKQTDKDGFVTATPERSTLWLVQTPQVFDFDLIRDCYGKVATLERRFTDDCSVAEYCGYRVKLLMGSYDNIKITTPEDLIIAEAVIRRRNDANRAGL